MNINEIAKLADVSRAAVSRYLNNGYVSEEKKERIKKVIKETGYRPSSQAQTLRTKKTKMIGVVLPKINSSSISRMVAGISGVLSGSGYQMLLANTDTNIEEELNYLKVFKENYVDGIIFFATILTGRHKKLLGECKVPVVMLGQRIKGYSCVYQDDYQAAKDLAEILLRGSRRPCFIGVTEKDEAVGKNRRAGFEAVLSEMQIECAPKQFVEADFSMESGYRKMQELLKMVPDTDAVFCVTDSIAQGAMAALADNKKAVPDQVRLAGMGDAPLSRMARPRLTTVHFHYRTSGAEAAKILLEQIDGKKDICRDVQMGYEIVEEESTGKSIPPLQA